MYRLEHRSGGPSDENKELAPSLSLESLADLKKEAIRRTRLPETPTQGEMTISRAEDGKVLFRWIHHFHEWKAQPPADTKGWAESA